MAAAVDHQPAEDDARQQHGRLLCGDAERE